MKVAFKIITDVYKISLNSLRSGGASAAANTGTPIIYSNVMADGLARMQRTVMFRTIWTLCCLFLVS